MILLSFFKPFPPQKPLPVRLSSWASHYLPLLFITSAAWPLNHLHGFGCPSHLAPSYRKGPPSLSRQTPPARPPALTKTQKGIYAYILHYHFQMPYRWHYLLYFFFYFTFHLYLFSSYFPSNFIGTKHSHIVFISIWKLRFVVVYKNLENVMKGLKLNNIYNWYFLS